MYIVVLLLEIDHFFKKCFKVNDILCDPLECLEVKEITKILKQSEFLL